MNYKKLEYLLSQAAITDRSDIWVSANDLTNKIILERISEIRRSKGNFLEATSKSVNMDDIADIPLDTLKIIDQLWIECSGGHFGFSIQLSIYETCENLKKFYECVSWEYLGTADPNHCPDFDVFRFGYPIWIAGPDFHLSCFLSGSYQFISHCREASIKAAKGNLPYCVNLVPSILLLLKGCQ